MSEELKFIEESIEPVAIDTEPAKLDDLSLALVGGGNCVVTF